MFLTCQKCGKKLKVENVLENGFMKPVVKEHTDLMCLQHQIDKMSSDLKYIISELKRDKR